MKILVTGAEGFIGRNLQVALGRIDGVEILGFDITSELTTLSELLRCADLIVHLAGVNRPKDPKEFIEGNLGLTSMISEYLEENGLSTPIIFASSIQAELENDYGKSKKAAENRLMAYAEKSNAAVRIFRFANVFGKWCRPNYNSVVATFCHNIAHDVPIMVNDPSASLRLLYVDDAVAAIIREILVKDLSRGFALVQAGPVYETSVGHVAETIKEIRAFRMTGRLPDFSDPLVKKLNSTYLSYLDPVALPVPAKMKRDERGWLFELVKSSQAGQIFVSTTKPGKRRGNHFHDTKVEKFCVVRGKARISLRRIDSDERHDFCVEGEQVTIIDIPPGYTHSIVNIGDEDCITIFWANEILDQDRPDTYFLEV